MAENKLPDFLVIPSVLILDKDLRPTDHLIYGVIYWYSKLKLEKCILSNASFASLLGITERAVQYGLQRMASKNYIHVVYEDSSKKVRVEIIPLVSFTVNEAKLFVPPTNKHSSPPHQMFTPPRTNVHQNKKDLIRESNNILNICQEILEYYNSKRGTKYKSAQTICSNVDYWMKQYSVEEIKTAIDNIGQHSFWKDKMTPTILFRKQNPRKENVDYIGELINVQKGGSNGQYQNANRAEKGKYSNIKYEGGN